LFKGQYVLASPGWPFATVATHPDPIPRLNPAQEPTLAR
jgi:hypothetical protein